MQLSYMPILRYWHGSFLWQTVRATATLVTIVALTASEKRGKMMASVRLNHVIIGGVL